MRSLELQQLQGVLQHLAHDPQLSQAQAALTAQLTAQVMENLRQGLATLGGLALDAPALSGVPAYQSPETAFARPGAPGLAHARP